MNIKLITKALHTLSLLSDEDYDLLMKLRSLSESEREALILVLEPQKSASKKSTKKASKSAGKSARASGMAEQLSSRRQQQQEVAKSYCIAERDDNGGLMPCGAAADANVHHLSTHPDFHEFVAPTQDAQAAASGD